MPWCILLTGMPNSGKSTIAYHLVQSKLRNVLVIDGDKHREAQFLGERLGFTEEHILRNNEHVIKLARFAQDQGFNVLIPQIAPILEQRLRMRKSLDCFLDVLCACPDRIRAERDNFVETDITYQYGHHDVILFTDTLSIAECVERVTDQLRYKQVMGG